MPQQLQITSSQQYLLLINYIIVLLVTCEARYTIHREDARHKLPLAGVGFDILAHNLETIPRLYTTARQYSHYELSLKILQWTKALDATIYTKSGIMLGLGETREEVLQTMDDLRKVKCDFLTIGQYLRPTPQNVEVIEYIHPDTFDRYREEGERMGFSYVASAPFVRSSFHAEEALKHIDKKPS